MEEEAKDLEKVVIELRTQAEIKEGVIREAVREACWRELGEVIVSSLLVICLHVG